MATKIIRRLPSILVALTLCYAFQMAGFVMISPLFARLFESFGAGVQALGASAMAYALTGKIATPFIGMLADPYPDCAAYQNNLSVTDFLIPPCHAKGLISRHRWREFS